MIKEMIWWPPDSTKSADNTGGRDRTDRQSITILRLLSRAHSRAHSNTASFTCLHNASEGGMTCSTVPHPVSEVFLTCFQGHALAFVHFGSQHWLLFTRIPTGLVGFTRFLTDHICIDVVVASSQ